MSKQLNLGVDIYLQYDSFCVKLIWRLACFDSSKPLSKNTATFLQTIFLGGHPVEVECWHTSYQQIVHPWQHFLYSFYQAWNICRYCDKSSPGPVVSPKGTVGLEMHLHTNSEGVFSGFKGRYQFMQVHIQWFFNFHSCVWLSSRLTPNLSKKSKITNRFFDLLF